MKHRFLKKGFRLYFLIQQEKDEMHDLSSSASFLRSGFLMDFLSFKQQDQCAAVTHACPMASNTPSPIQTHTDVLYY